MLQKLIFGSWRKMVGTEPAANTNIYSLELAKPISKEYISSTPRARVQINSLFTTYRLLDIKAEINIITDELARAAGLAIWYSPRIGIKSYTRYRKEFIGVCKDVSIYIRAIEIVTSVFVVKGADHVLVLSQLFIQESKVTFEYKKVRQ